MKDEMKYLLDDEELESVVGGVGNLTDGRAVNIIGSGCEDSYGGGVVITKYIGKPGLTLGRVYTDGRAAPYGIMIGTTLACWAPALSVQILD